MSHNAKLSARGHTDSPVETDILTVEIAALDHGQRNLCVFLGIAEQINIEDMGVLQTTQAQTQSGEYVDVVLGALWIKLEMEAGLRNLALTTGKIPYTNAGIALLKDVAIKVLQQGAVNGIILLDENGNATYTMNAITREQSSVNDRADRQYNGISWTASLAGAIEHATISGTLEV